MAKKSRRLRQKIASKQAEAAREQWRAGMIERATARLSPKQKALLLKQQEKDGGAKS